MASLLHAETLDALGTHRPLRHGSVTANDIRKYCVAVDDRNPIYTNLDAARAAGFPDVVAPPLFAHAAMRPSPFQSELLPDGQLPDLAPPGLSHLQSLLAGQDWEFLRPIVAGEQLTEDTWYGAIEERSGRSGPMVFVTEESLISTQAGEPVMRSSNHLIFRPAPPPSPPHDGGDARDASQGAPSQVIAGNLVKRPSLVALFMFDAVIWATHRLHWDAAQAQREGLPAPVLPGWMAASYLCEHAVTLGGPEDQLSSLSLRYKSFAFPGDSLTCCASEQREGLGLSLTNQHGVEVQSGQAVLRSPVSRESG